MNGPFHFESKYILIFYVASLSFITSKIEIILFSSVGWNDKYIQKVKLFQTGRIIICTSKLDYN